MGKNINKYFKGRLTSKTYPPFFIHQNVGLVLGHNITLSFFTKTAIFPVKTPVFRLSDISVFVGDAASNYDILSSMKSQSLSTRVSVSHVYIVSQTGLPTIF